MASRREQILAAIVARLADDPGKPPALTVHRFRTRPLEVDHLPALVVYVGNGGKGGVGDDVSRMDHEGGVEHQLWVRLELRFTGEPPDLILDPLYVWAVKAIRAEPTFGGLARDTEERSTAIDAEEKDRVYGAAAVDFLVTFASNENDPEAAA